VPFRAREACRENCFGADGRGDLQILHSSAAGARGLARYLVHARQYTTAPLDEIHPLRQVAAVALRLTVTR